MYTVKKKIPGYEETKHQKFDEVKNHIKELEKKKGLDLSKTKWNLIK